MQSAVSSDASPAHGARLSDATRRSLEGAFWPVVSLTGAMLLFGIFVAFTDLGSFR